MSNTARNAILSRIRAALSDVPAQEWPEDIRIPENYRQSSSLSRQEVTELFSERVEEYRAEVQLVDERKLSQKILECCRKQGVKKLVVPAGFDKRLLPEELDVIFDHPESPLSHDDLDRADGVITNCAYGVAQTGTIILDAGPGQGRRVLSLLPDYHLCIIQESQIVELIPEGFAAVAPSVKNEQRPITFISGPSATSDIELSRVEGVHGPRRLEVLVVSG